MVFCGIDPGISGAIAVLGDVLTIQDKYALAVRFYDTPILTIKTGKKLKNTIDANAAALLLQAIHPDYVVIESVQAMPGRPGAAGGPSRSMGATSAFNFGLGFGVWLGILAALQIPFEKVHPKRWKAALMKDMGKEKDASRIKAMQLYPGSAKSLNLKKHHGRADALLLAEYGRRDYLGDKTHITNHMENPTDEMKLPF